MGSAKEVWELMSCSRPSHDDYQSRIHDGPGVFFLLLGAVSLFLVCLFLQRE